LLWATGALVLLIVATNTLRKEPDVRMACYLIGGASIFRSYMLTIRGVLQGLERFGWESIVVIADRVLLLTLGTYALWSGGGLRGLTIAFVAARGLALLLAAVITQMRLGGIALTYDRDAWRDLHLTALPLGFFLIVLNLYQYADGVMLGYFRNDAETGLYGAAFKVYEGLTYAATAISAVLTPRLSALFISDRTRASTHVDRRHRRNRGYRRSHCECWIHSRAAAADDPLRQRVRRRGPTVPYSLRRPADCLRDLDSACDRHFVDREKLLLQTGLIGLAVNVGLNLYLIPHYGPNGAAWATVAGELVSMLILTAGLRAAWSIAAPPASSRIEVKRLLRS
jgi:O-antigen/teichoic acid export membrane protein